MRFRPIILAFAVAATVALLGGCSADTRQKILPYFFDGVATAEQRARPPIRRVRRDLVQEIEQLKRELADARAAATQQRPVEETRPAVERARNWQEVSELLPTDDSGRVDWVKALKSHAVAPRAAIDPGQLGHAALELDVELTTSGLPMFAVKYAHAPHTEWLTCANCHPAIFPLGRQATSTVITMARIKKGEYCGACHGKVAFGLQGACARCHVEIPAKSEWRPAEEARTPIERAATWEEARKLLPVKAGSPDWIKALRDGIIAPRPAIGPKAEDEAVFEYDVELIPPDAPAFKVVFPHEAHTRVLACATCHPGIFQMAAGADPITMEKIDGGEYCGRCHGNVAFDPASACDRCHPLAGG